jgi:capsular exopolysaccharide synthesis family protein
VYKRRIASASDSRRVAETTDWLHPPSALHGLRRSVQTLRERLRVLLGGLAVTLAVALVYLATADKVYQAEAKILATPVPTQDPVLSTIGIVTESPDPTLDVETAARLVATPAVANLAASDLGGDISGKDLLDSVSVQPIPESNVVTVEAKGPSAKAARDRANAFAIAAVDERRKEIRENIDAVLPHLERNLASATGTSADALASLITQLNAFRASGNPTIQVETQATAPSGPSSPHTVLVLFAAVVGGLALGLAAAFALQVLDPRLRREEQLRSLYGLPILGRIPREPRYEGPLTPERLSPPAREAYRTLRATLGAAGQREGGPRSILISGPGASEGKSSTAINLAASLALSGNRVILIEADLRRPSIAKALGVTPAKGVISVLLEHASLSEALVPVYNKDFRVLAADRAGADLAELLSLPAALRLLDEADQLADYVIIDSPPLSEVVDALQLARHADTVLIVAQLGRSHLNKIRELAELLASNGIRPAGFALIGVAQARDAYHYYMDAPAAEQQSPKRAVRARSLG